MHERSRRASAIALAALAALCQGAGRLEAKELLDYHHTAWTSDNGLGGVSGLYQAPDGYLWLTTSKGVFRFDGVRFESADEATNGGAQNRELDSVFVARDGGVWFSTQRKGLIRWKDGKLTAYADRRCTPPVKNEGIEEDLDGSLWVRASAGLAHLRDGVCEPVGRDTGYPGGFAKGMLVDSRGTLWVEMQSGALLYRRKREAKFQSAPDGLGAPAQYSYLREAPDGAIWLSDGGGLRRITDTSGKLRARRAAVHGLTEDSRIGNFVFTADGSLWAATRRGVERFDRSRVRDEGLQSGEGESFTTGRGLSSDVVWKLLIDREGSVWAATNTGLDRLRRSALSAIALPAAVTRNYQFAIAAGDGGNVWIGSRGVPLTRVSQTGEIRTFGETRQSVGIRSDHNGTVWSGGMGHVGGGQLWRTKGAGLERIPYPADDVEIASSMAVDKNNEVWISTFAPNVHHLVDGKWRNENEAVGRKAGVIGTMREDGEGNVWFAFSNQVVKWDGKKYQRWAFKGNARTGPINLSVMTLAFRDDRVWLGGLGGVLLFRKGEFRKMRWRNEDLPGAVSGIVETREGDLWLNGFEGIVHVPAVELSRWLSDPDYRVSPERLDALDGLAGLVTERWPEPSLVEASDGRLWFATAKGVSWLDPRVLEQNRNKQAPPVRITSVTGDGTPLAAMTTSQFAPHTKDLQFDYTALSLVVPERVKFRYKLEGADEDWHDAGSRRQAFYNNLPPGPYRFTVTACNNDGVWSEAGASVDFSMRPAFYQTVWWRALLAAAAMGGLWMLWRLRIDGVERQLELRFAERLDERERIARELHDTLLQSTVGLVLQFQHAADSLSGDPASKKRLERALDQAEAVMREGRERVKELRSGTAGPGGMVEELAGVARQFEALSGAAFRLSVQGEARPLRAAVHEEVIPIAREALINAFTHANASDIHLEISYLSGCLMVSVTDDGRGIEEQVLKAGQRQNHWGLPGMRERARKIRAHLQLECPVRGGTRLELRVPGRLAYEKRGSRFAWLRPFLPTAVRSVPE